jgi:hypothetical protein
MVTDNGMIATIAPIEDLNDPIAMASTTREVTSAIVTTTTGAITSQERREFITQGKDPNTGEPLSLQDHHYKLIMMNASGEEWATYYERARKVHAL